MQISLQMVDDVKLNNVSNDQTDPVLVHTLVPCSLKISDVFSDIPEPSAPLPVATLAEFDSNIISPSPPAPNNLVLSSKKLSETTSPVEKKK